MSMIREHSGGGQDLCLSCGKMGNCRLRQGIKQRNPRSVIVRCQTYKEVVVVRTTTDPWDDANTGRPFNL